MTAPVNFSENIRVMLCPHRPAVGCGWCPGPSPWVDTKPLSVDTGVTGLKLTLRRLHTTARLMHTTAHPDDEDGGMLTLESRGHGVAALQLTLNRGEGGQNKVGSNLLDELGIRAYPRAARRRSLLRRRAAIHPRG